MKFSRRHLLKTASGLLTAPAFQLLESKESLKLLTNVRRDKGHAVVIGAGASGGWTALHLLRNGYRVTLIDQFGPGNNQSSSGGETRLFRAYYDDQHIYFSMALRSLKIWKDNEHLFQKKIFHQNGLVMFHEEKEVQGKAEAMRMYRETGLNLEELTPEEATHRWPFLNLDNVNHVLYDPNAGYLLAREGCQQVINQFKKEGGEFLLDECINLTWHNLKVNEVTMASGRKISPDVTVVAAGPWITRLFPQLTEKIRITRQGYFYISPASNIFRSGSIPCWFNRPGKGGIMAYGIPENDFRGFKVAIPLQEDITESFDRYDRSMKADELARAKSIITMRFPELTGRPVIEQRICQYTETPDANFIIDQHPEALNLWIVSCCSGHGYKHGAAIGELVAGNITGQIEMVELFRFNRLLKR